MSTPRKACDTNVGRVSEANPEAAAIEIAIGIGTTVGHGTLNVDRLTINDVAMVSGRMAAWPQCRALWVEGDTRFERIRPSSRLRRAISIPISIPIWMKGPWSLDQA